MPRVLRKLAPAPISPMTRNTMLSTGNHTRKTDKASGDTRWLSMMESVILPNCAIRDDMTLAMKNEPNMFFNTYSFRCIIA